MKYHLKASLRHCAIASAILGIILGISGYVLYNARIQNMERLEAERASYTVHSILKLMQYEFEGMVADVRLLSNMRESKKVFTDRMTADLAKNLLYFALDKKTYDTIRYLDADGMEMFRINYRSGHPTVVKKDALQDLSDTYFFKGSSHLKVGSVYVSPLDLDREFGGTPDDPKPIIRFAAPLFGSLGERQGVVMLNYFGDQILRILQVASKSNNDAVMLLNEGGYWLRSPNPEDEWGFMREGGEDNTFRTRYPEEWSAVKQIRDGQVRTANGLFSFHTLDPGEMVSEQAGIPVTSQAGEWIILVRVPQSVFEDAAVNYRNTLLTTLIPLACLLMLGIYFICLYRQNNKRAQMRIMEEQASYARFVPKEFLNALGTVNYRDLSLESHANRSMAIMFSDIRSYTKLSESLTHGEVLQFLNDYFNVVNEPIQENAGFVDSFHGDALLALFDGDNVDGAVRAAIGMQRAITLFNAFRGKRGEDPVAAGIGIHFGEVTLGALGTEERMQATVIGDAVNLAARIESATKAFGVKVVISDSVYEQLSDTSAFKLREIDTVRVKGKQQPVVLYEVYDIDPDDLMERKSAVLDDFCQALDHYKAGDFQEASELFESCAERCPGDPISPIFFKRCKTMLRLPKDPHWTGISTL